MQEQTIEVLSIEITHLITSYAMAMVVAMGDISTFKNGRELAAWLV